MWHKNTCDICGKKDVQCVVCASSFVGPFSFAYCVECFNDRKEPYGAMVNYIACAGRFPDDINETYRAEVKRQLLLHNVSEEKFIKDVDEAIKEMNEIYDLSEFANYKQEDIGDVFDV